jgi:hypothetical protein
MAIQEIRVPHNAAYDFGVGVDRLSGAAMNKVVGGDPSGVLWSGGSIQSFEVKRVRTSRDLQQSLGIDVEASYGCATFGAGASARFSYMRDVQVQSTSLFMTVTATVHLADLSIDECVLTPSAAAMVDRPDVFATRYGNMFARACKRGGLFAGVMRVETYSEQVANTIEAELKGSYGLFSAEASFKFSEVARTHNASVYCSVYAEGGPAVQIDDPTDPVELLRRANEWIKAMQERPERYARPYEWTLAPTSIAEGPLPLNAIDIQRVQDILTFCARERTTLLDRLNLLTWIRSHPERFDWTGAPADEAILLASRATQADLDTVAACASAAINDPAGARMPAAFAAERGASFPSAVMPSPLPRPLPAPAAAPPPRPLNGFTIERSLRGVLHAGGWRSAADLDTMSREDQRNTLIVELNGHTSRPAPYFQGFDDDTLIGKGAVAAFLHRAGIRDRPALRSMTDDDQRNTLIVENAGRTGVPVPTLQGMNDYELVRVGLNWLRQ